MSDDLAARLRGLGTHATRVAADRIEAQAARIAELEARMGDYCGGLEEGIKIGMEEAAKISEKCQRQNGPLSNLGFPERYRAGFAAGAQAIAAAIRAAAKEGKL